MELLQPNFLSQLNTLEVLKHLPTKEKNTNYNGLDHGHQVEKHPQTKHIILLGCESRVDSPLGHELMKDGRLCVVHELNITGNIATQ